MAPIRMSFASGLYDRMVPLAMGEVKPKGIDLNFLDIHHPRDIFDRASANQEFDACELSTSEYICQYCAGNRQFIAIPAFPSRAFRHGFIAVNSNKVKSPKDLEGKKVGVQLYTMTAAVWQRGHLQHEYGVNLDTIEWVEGKMEGPGSHGKPSALPPLKPVKITTNTQPKSLSQLLADGDIDATIGADPPDCLGKVPHVQRLFPNFKEVEKEYYKKTSIFPVMHLVVLKRDFYDANKFAASSLFEALNESKELARKRMNYTSALRYMLPWLPEAIDDIRETFGEDCWPYGLVEENRKTIAALIDYLHEQSMIEWKPNVDELFAPVTLTRFKMGLNDSLP
jgi:4,5-dihydroxyphthalate decarboxylase